MSKSADDKLKELLQEKFGGFETTVEDSLWRAVEGNIGRPFSSVKPSFSKVSSVFATLVILLVFTGDVLKTTFTLTQPPVGLNSRQNGETKPTPSNRIMESTVTLEGATKQSAPSANTGSNTRKVNLSPIKTLKLAGAPEQALLAPDFTGIGKKNPLISSILSPALAPLTIPPMGRNANSTTGLEVPTTASKHKFGWEVFNGVDLHYLRLQPNPADTLFFIASAKSFQASPARAGVSPGIRTSLRLTPRLHVNMSVVMALRRHPLALSYQSLNQFGEPAGETRSSASYTVVSGGLAMGLSYRLTQFKIERRFDFGVDLQHSVHNPLAQNALVAYPNTLVSFNWGLSHYFNSRGAHRWVVRPNCGYSLNKKRSDAPLTAAPYSFGISVGVEF